jgi:phosphoenolpyruvate carboxylase
LSQVEILWRTDEMRATKPTVLEEIVTGLDYFRYSLFEAVCTTYRYAENSINVSNLFVNDLFLRFISVLGLQEVMDSKDTLFLPTLTGYIPR